MLFKNFIEDRRGELHAAQKRWRQHMPHNLLPVTILVNTVQTSMVGPVRRSLATNSPEKFHSKKKANQTLLAPHSLPEELKLSLAIRPF